MQDGFSYSKNSRLGRLTAWSNDPELDIPSEIIYIKDQETKEAWSLGRNPMPDDNEYRVIHGFGYSKYLHEHEKLAQELTVFVAKEEAIKINLLKLQNNNPMKKELRIIYYLKPVLNEDENKTNGLLDLKKEGNILFVKNLCQEVSILGTMYVSSSEKITSYTGSKDFFLGKNTLENPESLKKVSLDNANCLGQNTCVAMELYVTLEAFETKEISICLGEHESMIDSKNLVYQYSSIANCREELRKVTAYWRELLQTLQVETPVRSLDIILNGWAVYQTICARLWARSRLLSIRGSLWIS